MTKNSSFNPTVVISTTPVHTAKKAFAIEDIISIAALTPRCQISGVTFKDEGCASSSTHTHVVLSGDDVMTQA